MSKKKKNEILVMPKSGRKFDLNNVSREDLVNEFKVPQSLFDIIGSLIPSFLNFDRFSIDPPKFDTDSQTLKLKLTINDDCGNPQYIIKLQIAFGDEGKHKVVFSTDGGETWRELTYKGAEKKETECDNAYA